MSIFGLLFSCTQEAWEDSRRYGLDGGLHAGGFGEIK